MSNISDIKPTHIPPMPKKAKMEIVKKDAVVINRTIFCTPEEAERVRQKVIQQIRDDGVAMLPIGFTAEIVSRDCVFLGGEEE